VTGLDETGLLSTLIDNKGEGSSTFGSSFVCFSVIRTEIISRQNDTLHRFPEVGRELDMGITPDVSKFVRATEDELGFPSKYKLGEMRGNC
jgi:hypothetical protein